MSGTKSGVIFDGSFAKLDNHCALFVTEDYIPHFPIRWYLKELSDSNRKVPILGGVIPWSRYVVLGSRSAGATRRLVN